MKFSLSWLFDHLETEVKIDEILEKFVDLGFEVESTYQPAKKLTGITLARVINWIPHPNADRLKICKVDDGSHIKTIVCGASNVREGMKTALAYPGTTVPTTGFILKHTNIRGIDSEGMMCSAKELGIEYQHDIDGILDITTELPEGSSIAQVLDLEDTIIHLAVTPNRGDCLSVRGLARDLAASGIGTLKKLPSFSTESQAPCSFSLTLQNPHCSYIKIAEIKGKKEKETPDWIRKRLQSSDQKLISPWVDITNYIMRDIGQPLHAYDASKLSGNNFIIRQGNDGESFQGLNDVSYTLNKNHIVMADSEKPLSLGGILGGQNSSVDEHTTHVLLEAAIFDAKVIAQTSQQLYLSTDAKMRFERGIDPCSVEIAFQYALFLMAQICDATFSKSISAGGLPLKKQEILFNPSLIKKKCGIHIENPSSILEKLGCHIIKSNDVFMVSPPSWRHDLTQDVDLVEEILRFHGYDQLLIEPLPLKAVTQTQTSSKPIKKLLGLRGFTETYSWSMVTPEDAHIFGGGLPLKGSKSRDWSVMRPTPLLGLLKTTASNAKRGTLSCAFFEIARRFQKNSNNSIHEELTIVGLRSHDYVQKSWRFPARKVDPFDVKEDVLAVLSIWNIHNHQIQYIQEGIPPYFHPTRACIVRQGRTVLGVLGEIHPDILDHFDIKGPIVAFEVPWLNRELKSSLSSPNLSLYPYVIRDFAFLIPVSTPADNLVRLAYKTNSTLVTNVRIFDVYQGKNVPEGLKSLAITVHLQSQERTLTEKDLEDFHTTLVNNVSHHLHGELRQENS